MRIGILTGGGDCPGLNAVIRAVVRKGEERYGDDFLGFMDGWRGLVDNITMPLDSERVRDIISLGGTILGTSRTNPYKLEDGVGKVLGTLNEQQVEALVAIGGDDTLGVANKLTGEGVQTVGVPKTIDNDLSATEVTFGFHTAVQIATDAIDRLRTTAESHSRVIVCEVMGRHAGWISIYSGIAGGAVDILIPEEPFDIASVCANVQSLIAKGRHAAVVVVAEGAAPGEGSFSVTSSEVDQFGHVRLGGIGNLLAAEIEKITGIETRAAILGHVQRGGSPTAYDRVLATRFGIGAIDAIHNGGMGTMVALQADKIVRVPLSEGVSEPKLVPHDFYEEVAKPFFG
ncbi:MAG TPA: ATP-dependent 6-phosphofructokinase [Acidimicrobiales bacterium]|nr:ATP-dependent 6-phosphofructokinase [Acidimicrobiales bacterium]